MSSHIFKPSCLGVILWWVVYSLIVCFMPKNGCCSFKAGLWQEGSLGWAFLKPHPQASGVSFDPSFCLASMGFFVSPGRRGFFCLSLDSERLQQQFFSGSSKWTGWFGFGPRSETGGKDKEPFCLGPTSRTNLNQQEKAHLLHLLWKGDQCQRLTRFHLFAWTAAWIYWRIFWLFGGFFPWKPMPFCPHQVANRYWIFSFPGILVLFRCVCAWGWRGLCSDNSMSSIYLLFTVICGHFVTKWLGCFSTFIH